MNLEFPVLDIERKGLIRPGTKTVNLAFGERLFGRVASAILFIAMKVESLLRLIGFLVD